MKNLAILIGNLGKKPEIRQVGDNGTSVASFTLATSEKFKTQSGETKEETTWHNLTVWGKLAEVCEKYLDKGDRIYVEGKIRNRSYEKDGKTLYFSDILVKEMKMLSSKKEGSSSSATSDNSKYQEPGKGYSAPASHDDEPDISNDLPF